MIIWKGRGALIAVIAFGCLLAMEFYTRSHYKSDTYYQEHGWPKLAAFLFSGAIVQLLLTLRRKDEFVGVASENPSKPIFREQDSLFFIPAKYWPSILCALGVVFYFVRG